MMKIVFLVVGLIAVAFGQCGQQSDNYVWFTLSIASADPSNPNPILYTFPVNITAPVTFTAGFSQGNNYIATGPATTVPQITFNYGKFVWYYVITLQQLDSRPANNSKVSVAAQPEKDHSLESTLKLPLDIAVPPVFATLLLCLLHQHAPLLALPLLNAWPKLSSLYCTLL
jgi:hypothetical protein